MCISLSQPFCEIGLVAPTKACLGLSFLHHHRGSDEQVFPFTLIHICSSQLPDSLSPLSSTDLLEITLGLKLNHIPSHSPYSSSPTHTLSSRPSQSLCHPSHPLTARSPKSWPANRMEVLRTKGREGHSSTSPANPHHLWCKATAFLGWNLLFCMINERVFHIELDCIYHQISHYWDS